MAHTPGPWRFQQDGNEPYWSVDMPHTDGSGRYGAYNAMVYTTEEDARLVASAPELLERLRAMVSGLECECDTADPEHPLCDVCWSRQVIAKAEGRSE